jgi:xanthine/uracil permease
MNENNHNLSLWQHIWYVCAGATGVMVVMSINEFPSLSEYQVTLLGWFINPLYSGLIWAMIALELTCIISGLILLFKRDFRDVPKSSRYNWALGFFLLGWIAALSFFIRLDNEIPTLLLWLAVGALVIVAALYWSLRRRMDAREELFP